MHAIWHELAMLTQSLPLSLIRHVFSKFVSVKMEDRDAKYLTAVSAVTLNALQPMHYRERGPTEWFGIGMMWDLLQDDAAPSLSDENSFLINTHLVRMLVSDHLDLVRVLFIEKCVENLKQMRTVPTSLFLMMSMISALLTCPQVVLSLSPRAS